MRASERDKISMFRHRRYWGGMKKGSEEVEEYKSVWQAKDCQCNDNSEKAMWHQITVNGFQRYIPSRRCYCVLTTTMFSLHAESSFASSAT